jgi:asparaginyl-tRNA synthetase
MRGNKQVKFIALNDGSCLSGIQVVADVAKFADELLKRITTGACISVEGLLVASQGGKQQCEVQAEAIEILGDCDPQEYPLQKKGHSLEFLREKAYLRPRTNTFGAVFRIRHNMAIAIHEFFHQRGFFYWNTPLITASDCEGAGQMFQVTTLNLYDLKKTSDGSIDYSNDFFGKMASLTVSGQLEGELGALSLGQIYTFGPTFRAENSNTPRHLSEFWMVEPEVAFADINENMALAEDFIKHCIQWALDNCQEDLQFLNDMVDNTLLERLHFVMAHDFQRLTYTEGIQILEAAVAAGHKFEFPVYWGVDLASEHERFLVEEHFKRPVILTDYPKEIKSFYMKQNEDGKTVRAMDVLFPKIGEIIGGSEREENYDKLARRSEEMGVPMKDIWWYLDTRRFGSAPHSGFGLGFERLILFVTGMANIRDVIPFPRTPNNAEF